MVNIDKWSLVLPFYVLEYGTDPINGYLGLNKMRLPLNCVLDSLVGDDRYRVLSNMIKMSSKVFFKEKNVK